MSIIMKTMKTAVRLAPESWLPGGTPDPLMNKHGLIGKPVSRIDGLLKVQGKARFAAEVPLPGLGYASLLYSTIARGRIATLETAEAEAAHGAATPDDVRAEGRWSQRLADHAGRGNPLEWPAGRLGARRNAGTGGPC